MPDQCFHAGDFWYAVAQTTPGQSPATNPELWRRIEIPARWRSVLGRKMEARLQRSEGQQDKAAAAERLADGLMDELRATVNQRGGRLPRLQVVSR